MKAIELMAFLYSLNGGWMDLKTTVDTIKAGNPDTELKGIAVGWQSYIWALEKALELGCNAFITHEPTFYNHHDRTENNLYAQFPGYAQKKQWIEEHELVIIRCHDLWDQMPGLGITDSWANLLGLDQVVRKDGYYQVYSIPETSAIAFARLVASKLKPFGQDALEFIGPLEKRVKSVGIGTGAATGLYEYLAKYELDLAVCTDDAFIFWRDGEYAIDQQFPVIITNHTVSEEIGIQNLALFLRTEFPLIPVHYISQGCSFRLVTGSET